MTAPYKRPPTPLVTADELYRMKERLDGFWYELEEGTMMLCEPSGFEHAGIGVHLIIRLGSYVAEHGLGQLVGADGTYVLARNPDTVRVPDVSFVRAHRIPEGRLTSKFFEGAPDLAVEIVSPGDRFPELERKVQQYLSAGTELVWVLRPTDQTAVVYRADGTTTKLSAHQSLDGEGVVPGFKVSLRALFHG